MPFVGDRSSKIVSNTRTSHLAYTYISFHNKSSLPLALSLCWFTSVSKNARIHLAIRFRRPSLLLLIFLLTEAGNVWSRMCRRAGIFAARKGQTPLRTVRARVVSIQRGCSFSRFVSSVLALSLDSICPASRKIVPFSSVPCSPLRCAPSRASIM